MPRLWRSRVLPGARLHFPGRPGERVAQLPGLGWCSPEPPREQGAGGLPLPGGPQPGCSLGEEPHPEELPGEPRSVPLEGLGHQGPKCSHPLRSRFPPAWLACLSAACKWSSHNTSSCLGSQDCCLAEARHQPASSCPPSGSWPCSCWWCPRSLQGKQDLVYLGHPAFLRAAWPECTCKGKG